MRFLKKFNESVEPLLTNSLDTKIERENGKLVFSFKSDKSKYWCRVTLVEGCATMVNGMYDTQNVRDIVVTDKDRKFKEHNLQEAIRWLWRAAQFIHTGGKNFQKTYIAGVEYYSDYKEESMLLGTGYFSRKYKEPIEVVMKNATTIGEIMVVMEEVKKQILKSFTAEKNMSRFGL